MVSSVLQHSLRALRRLPVPDLLSHRGAVANARTAVDRDRRVAAERTAADLSGDLGAVLRLLDREAAA